MNGFLKHIKWAFCVKVLTLEGKRNILSDGKPALQLHKDLLVHFPRVENLTLWDFPALDCLWPSSPSEATPCFPTVKKLCLYTIHSSQFSSIARFIASFPSIVNLLLHDVDWDANDDDEDDFIDKMPQPHIRVLDMWNCRAGTLNNVLFADTGAVELREVLIHTHSTSHAADWNDVLERAGSHLEKISLQHIGESEPSPFNLQENTCLSTVSMSFGVDHRIDWVSQTLESVQSPKIKRIELVNYKIGWRPQDLEFINLERMNEKFARERYQSLQSFMFYMVDIGPVRLGPTEEDEVITQRLTTIVKARLHKLNERGILRDQSPPPDDA
ncbi:hypothetical protein EIP86_009583 [Pleurotus ostreatoroseus]|nr:hypothetical protein EIP86_009583 [Pleurotus ostreatoroseus]